MELNERLQQIKANWLSIKEKDPGYAVPGAMSHKYHLDQETISRQDIENFENRNGFKLPEEYREYLIQVSNGGAGPFHVMYPLHDALDPLNKGTKGEEGYYDWLEETPDHYTSEFPVTEEQIIAWLTHKIKHATVETPPLEMAADEPGYLFLCTVESGKHYIMPVNGACVNEIWLMQEATRLDADGKEELYFKICPEVRFVNDQIKTLSFLEWIEDAQQNWFNTNTSLDHRLAAVKVTWFNLAAYDKGESVFGAFMHHYQMNPVLTEESLSAFEKQYGFTLPDEYRRYLKLVNNGGVGPFYGMYSLENSVIALNSGSVNDGTFVKYLEKHPDHFSKEFPVSEQQIIDYLNHRIHHRNEQAIPIKIDKHAGGYLFVSEYGCGGYYVMPLNGSVPGQIWYLQKPNANKLTYEMRDDAGNLVNSGSYGDDEDDAYFNLYPEVWFKDNSASTVNFLDWVENAQQRWFYTEENESSGGTGSESLNNENAYYPLAVGNVWTYDYAGQHMVNTIESLSGEEFITINSLNPVAGKLKKVNGDYFSDGFEKDNMQLILKDTLMQGDNWEVTFKANGLDCIYTYTVRETLPSKTVGGKEYLDVVMIELESFYVMNGTRMAMNAFTQNYYAKGVGVILTTTSGVIGNNSYPLLSYELK
jgi:hypothetical protein